jgi:hypothetical protein
VNGSPWSHSELAVLRRDYGKVPLREIAAALNRGGVAVRSMAKKLRIQRPYSKIVWTSDEEQLLRDLYPHQPSDAIARRLCRPISSVYQHAAALGLKKSAEYLEDAKRSGRFDTLSRAGAAFRYPKGHVPQNKGLRRPGWHRGRMKETQFKQGVRQGVAAKLWKPVGTERISKDGYLERKVNNDLPPQRRWKAVHRIVWEAANGAIPPGHVICFLPGMRTNERALITGERLELVHRAELARRNHWKIRLPKPLQEVVFLRTAIKSQITKRLKKDERSATRDRGIEKAPVRNPRQPEGQGKAAGRRPRESRV